MQPLFKSLVHAAIGGASVALTSIPLGVPITTKTVVYPALASAITSVFSLLCQSPVVRTLLGVPQQTSQN